MNNIQFSRRGWFKNHLATSFLALALTLPGVSLAQSILESAELFQPVYKTKQIKPTTLLNLSLFNLTPYSPTPQTPVGNVTWSHTLRGHTHVGLNIIIASADVQLAAFAQTTGTGLIFGRESRTTTGSVLGSIDVNNLLNQAVGLSVANSWSSRARVTNPNLTEGQLYTVNFDVTRGAGLNLNALSYANFALLGNGVAILNTESSTLLNVLDLLRLGSGAQAGEFQFYAPAGITSLDLVFTAATVADVTLVGGMPANQNVMEFSNFSFAPVPEVSSLALAGIGMLLLLRRRRPCQL